MFLLTRRLFSRFSLKDSIKKRIPEFIDVNAGVTFRNQPTQKQRKYKNVQITQDFKKIDAIRKKQRHSNMKKRQMLIQQKMLNANKLLSSPQLQSLRTELTTVQTAIKDIQKQITDLTTIINSTQPNYMVAEGYIKLVIMNHIKYLQYLHKNNMGYTLHPQTIKSMENVHYCINHNLPFNRINLYQFMPEFFEAQIGQLQGAVRQLIEQKQIFIQDEEATSSIRFFYKIKNNQQDQTISCLVNQQINNTFDNLCDYSLQTLKKHEQFIVRLEAGKTPFRGIQHAISVMQSQLPIKYLPQQQAFRKDILQILKFQKQFNVYKKDMEDKALKLTHSYIQPPPFVKNHPVLMKRYQEIMKVWTNPLPYSQTLQTGDQRQVQLGQNMQKQIRAFCYQKFDKPFVQAMNNDRSLIDKQKIQIQFYKLSTEVMQNILALQDKSKSQQEIFKVLPKQQKGLLSQRKKNLILTDQITRILYLNNKDKKKYNLQFFSQWLGVDKQQLQTVLKYISFIKYPLTKQTKTVQQVKIQILKFQF